MHILLQDYQPHWSADFLNQKSSLASILSPFNPLIEHIGSTAVPGLCSKPTIDILVGLPDPSLLDPTIAPMIAAGYTYFKKYEPAMPYRRLFSKLTPIKDKAVPSIIDIPDEFIRGQDFSVLTNIHILEKGTFHWFRHLAFRDYLRAHPDVRDEYARLKKLLSEREFKDTNEYNDLKDRFIKETQVRALAWYTQGQ